MSLPVCKTTVAMAQETASCVSVTLNAFFLGTLAWLLRRLSAQQRFAKAAQELSVVQARLLDLLGRFREFQGRTRLLKGFLLHMEQQPDFAPGNYAKLTNVPVLFNQSDTIIANAAPDVNNVEHEADYQNIVSD